MDEKLENAKFIQEICDEKKLIEKKYASLLEEVRKFSDDTKRRVQEKNYKKIMSGAEDELQALKKEVDELRQIQRTQADMLQDRKQEWDAERGKL
jgi:TolA-binding protein